jgi:DNA-directed RNA polymerase specialized sigma24 family protein
VSLEIIRQQLERLVNNWGVPKQDQEDIVQEVSLVLIRTWYSIDDRDAWLVKAVEKNCSEYWRKHRSRVEEGVDPVMLELLARPEMPDFEIPTRELLAGIQRGAAQPEDLSTNREELGQGSLISLELIDPLLLQILDKNPELLKTLDWRSFEKIIAQALERLGFEIELQRGTKDGGVDIFALKRDGIFGPHRYLLQAKRWTNAVGVEPVRELLFLQGHHRVTKSCLATTSRFTEGAWALAHAYQWQLELRDLDRLREWLNLAAHSTSAVSGEMKKIGIGRESTPNLTATPDVSRALRARRR